MALLDTDALESLLVEADRIAVRLHGNNDDDQGLIAEIKDCVKCMEDAINDLGGAYEAENDAAKRLIEAKEAIDNISQLVENALVDGVKKIEPAIETEVRNAIKKESTNIVDSLTSALKTELLESEIKTKVSQHIDDNIIQLIDNKITQAITLKDPQRNNTPSKKNFWREYGYIVLPLAIFGFICLLILAGLIMSGSINSVSIQNGNLIMEL